MERSSSVSPSPKAGALAPGVVIVILVLLIAAGIGMSFLPNPYFVIGEGIVTAVVVASCAAKLRSCYRLAKASVQLEQLLQVALWGFIGVVSVVILLGELSTAEQWPRTVFLVVLAFLMALLSALQLVEILLKVYAGTNTPTRGGAWEEAKTPPM